MRLPNELYKNTWSSPGIRLFRADEGLRSFPGESFHTFGESVWFIDLPQKAPCLFMLWLKISMRRRFSLQITRRVVQEGGGVFDIDSWGCHTVSGDTGQFWGTQGWGWCWQGFLWWALDSPVTWVDSAWWLFICKQGGEEIPIVGVQGALAVNTVDITVWEVCLQVWPSWPTFGQRWKVKECPHTDCWWRILRCRNKYSHTPHMDGY